MVRCGGWARSRWSRPRGCRGRASRQAALCVPGARPAGWLAAPRAAEGKEAAGQAAGSGTYRYVAGPLVRNVKRQCYTLHSAGVGSVPYPALLTATASSDKARTRRVWQQPRFGSTAVLRWTEFRTFSQPIERAKPPGGRAGGHPDVGATACDSVRQPRRATQGS